MSTANQHCPATEPAENYAPGSVGCHELLDRTSMLADMVERYLVSHPASASHPEWLALAERATGALNDLYQRVGAEHLSAAEPQA